MDTNEQIESLDEVAPVTNEEVKTDTNPSPLQSNALDNSANTIQNSGPQPISLGDMATPTDLQNTDINSFGQEGINVGMTNQNPKPSSLENVIKSEEYNDIGKVPPNANNEAKPKKKKSKLLLILLAIILIAGVGFGVYYYLGLGNKGSKLSLKTIKINVSEQLSTNINDYVSSGKVDSSCVTNFDDVNINTVGTYTYKIICNSGTFSGTIQVVDENAPSITLKTPIIYVNNEVSIDDFVESCSDEDCHYEFADQDALKANLSTAGTYEVKILVSDDSNNSKTVTAYLIVTDNLINRQLVCNSQSTEVQEDNYSYIIKDTMPIAVISSNLAYSGFTIREYTLTYSTKEAYKAAVATIKEDNTIETSIASGIANYDDSKDQIIITQIKNKEEMISEFTDYPDSYSDLRNKYENDERSFECIIGFDN